jgi:hypothetical protein
MSVHQLFEVKIVMTVASIDIVMLCKIICALTATLQIFSVSNTENYNYEVHYYVMD